MVSEQHSAQPGHQYALIWVALIYMALIFSLWTIYVAYVYPWIVDRPHLALRVLFNELFRAGIFLIPISLSLRHVAGERPLRFLRLDIHVVQGLAWGTVVGLIYLVGNVVYRALFTEGGLQLRPIPVEAWFASLSTATLVEEIAFRGFLLQVLARGTHFWLANAVTSCAFAAIHLPGWIMVGHSTIIPEKLVQLGAIFLLGLVLGYLLRRTRSLWSCFAAHALNNLAAIIAPL